MITIRQYSVGEFVEYLQAAKDAGAVLRATFLHHTWSPDADDYRGIETIEGIRAYHIRRGFSDIACHVYAAPDGTVFNGRPPSTNNCACQYPAKPSHEWPADLRRLSGGDKRWMNAYGFSCETIGDFDSEDPTTSVAMRTSLDVLAAVHRIWDIPVAHSFFHRDVAYKTCPGSRVTKAWVHDELRRRLADDPAPPADELKVVLGLGPDPHVIDCNARLENGKSRCDLRPLAEALGYQVIPDHIADQGKIYLHAEE